MKKQHPNNPLVYSTDPELMKPVWEEEEATLPPAQQKLKVRTDNKQRSGKTVTLVEGFRGKTGDAEVLGKLLKMKCGSGGSVKDGVILLQGDYKNKVIQLLQQLQYKVS